MIWSSLQPQIDNAHICIVDTDIINPNVAFECGYAIAKGRHPILIRHHNSQHPILPCLKAFRHLTYYTRHDLISQIVKLLSEPGWHSRLSPPITALLGSSPAAYPNLAPHTDIYLLAVRPRQDPVLRLKRELDRRPYSVHSDGIEPAFRINTRDIIKSLVRFNNIAIHLVGDLRSTYDDLITLTSVATFFAGIANGLAKELRLFQQIPTQKEILDLETLLSSYQTESEIVTAARRWKEDFTARANAFEEERKNAAALLVHPAAIGLPADLGDPWAERDGLLNDSTFFETPRTRRIRNGDGILYVGPRGCGKTADFINLTTKQASTASRLTVAVKLTDADIISMRGIGQELFSNVDRHNIYRHVWRLAIIALLVEEYERLKTAIPSLQPVAKLEDVAKDLDSVIRRTGDLELTDMVADLISTVNQQDEQYRNSQELIRKLAFPTGRAILDSALTTFDIRIAVDGLDQGWDPNLKEATELLVALIDEVHDLEQRYRPKLKVAVFALQELYREISSNDRDSDKRAVEYYSWDKAQLADMVGARILAVTSGQRAEQDPRDTWPIIFEPDLDGSSTFDYVVERSLMRPRHVLRFCREALIRANNRRNVTVSVDDILESEELYSDQLIDDLALEYSDRYPGIGDIILEFFEAPPVISYDGFRYRINAMFAADAISEGASVWLCREDRYRVMAALKALYDVGFIGVIGDRQVIYSYMQKEFERLWPRDRRIRTRRRRGSRQRLSPQQAPRYPRLSVHPAFHKGLAISAEPTD